ncbi:MAG: PEP-CTERM sorting domain-containing protein [Pirellulaceae bacterium]
MFKSTIGSLLLLTALAMPSKSDGATVAFLGTMTSGSGVLGTAPPTFDFAVSLDFTQTTAGFATVNNGLFSSSRGNISIAGGDIVLLEGGTNDLGLISLDTASPLGSIAVTFQADAILNNNVTTENLIALINAAAPSTLSADFLANGNYTGSVTSAVAAVPEPSSSGLLLGGVLFAALRRRRPRPQP